MIFDHACWLVASAARTSARLRDEHGLGSEPGAFFAEHGTQHHNVPMCPPQYLELAELVGTPSLWVQRCLDEAVPVVGWAVLVDDLEGVARERGLDVHDRTLRQPDGSLRGWRAASGPEHLPFFIDYPDNGDRTGRWAAMRERVGTGTVGPVTRLQLEQDAAELREWLGSDGLPLDVRPGTRGLVALDVDGLGTIDLAGDGWR